MNRITFAILGIISLTLASSANAQPGAELTEEHKVLHQDLGTWNVKMKLWPQGPDGIVVEGVCQEHNRKLGNGLWILSDFKGTLAGTAFYGHGTFGYNPRKEKYVGTWVDNMTPAISQMQGTYDKKSNTLTMYSEGTDAATGNTTKTKNVSEYIDKNNRKFTMYVLKPGTKDEYVKMMQLQYTRADLKDKAENE